MAASLKNAQRICVARVGAAHGVRGEVKLWSYTAEPAAVASYGPLETADGRLVEIEALRPANEFFVARLKGISDRSAAQRLRNAELFVKRERLPAPQDEEEFYHADLVGLEVVDPDGTLLGSVVALHNFGAGDVIEVRPADRGDTLMLPFTHDAVPQIDIAGRRVVVAADAFAAARSREAR